MLYSAFKPILALHIVNFSSCQNYWRGGGGKRSPPPHISTLFLSVQLGVLPPQYQKAGYASDRHILLIWFCIVSWSSNITPRFLTHCTGSRGSLLKVIQGKMFFFLNRDDRFKSSVFSTFIFKSLDKDQSLISRRQDWSLGMTVDNSSFLRME